MASSGKRIVLFGMIGALVFAMSVLRTIQIQAFDPDGNAAKAAQAMKQVRPLYPVRGQIVDRNGVVLALSQPAVRIIADPAMIQRNGISFAQELSTTQQARAAKAPMFFATMFAKYLGGKVESYLPSLNDAKSRYVIVARQVPAYVYAQMRQEMDPDPNKYGDEWNGIYSEPDPIRSYPAGTLASNVLGFVHNEEITKEKGGEASDRIKGYINVGAGGLEYALEKQLRGQMGQEIFDYGRWGRVPLGTNVLQPAVNGTSYKLTLDAEMQWMAEKALAEGVAKAKATSGIAVVMNIKNGEVLALANVPTFDSNDYKDTKTADLGNRAVSSTYEPGSVQKLLTMSILADAGIATPQTRLDVPYQIRSGGSFIKDAWRHGTLHLTARGVIAKSSNVGAVQLGRRIDKTTFTDYLKKFGLGSTTGIGLPGEATGKIPGSDMADYTRDQISFGSGLSVTSVQMAAAIAAIANGGVYNQPTIIASTVSVDGKNTPYAQAEPRRVISAEAALMVMDTMESVVTDGGSKKLAIEGIRTAGKTGTASRYDSVLKRYSGYTASFVGVAPAENPQILVYVVVDNPKNGHYGGTVAGPIYKDIMQVAAGRYGIMPSTTPPPRGAIEYKK